MPQMHRSRIDLLCYPINSSKRSHFCRRSAFSSVLPERPPGSERWNYYVGEKHGQQFLPRTPASQTFRDLLHAVNLRHGTHGFTSLPKEGMLRIFPPLKIRRLQPGLNPRTWVPKASTLPLDHRSRSGCAYSRTGC